MNKSIRIKINISKPLSVVNNGILEGVKVIHKRLNVKQSIGYKESVFYKILFIEKVYYKNIIINSLTISAHKTGEILNSTELNLNLLYEFNFKNMFQLFFYKITTKHTVKLAVENHLCNFKNRIEKWC